MGVTTLSMVSTVQDRVGAQFGVSGAVVVIVAVVAGLLWWNAAGDTAKDADLDRAVRTGDGLLATRQGASQLTQVCFDGGHDRCAGRISSGAQQQERPCGCTCHARAVTRFCGELARHDLCVGAVVMGGLAAGCGCTCHRSQGVEGPKAESSPLRSPTSAPRLTQSTVSPRAVERPVAASTLRRGMWVDTAFGSKKVAPVDRPADGTGPVRVEFVDGGSITYAPDAVIAVSPSTR